MSTKKIIAWINGSAQIVEVQERSFVAPELTIEERIEALEQTQSPEFVNSITLRASNWSGNASPYSQVVNIPGITSNSKIDLQPNTEQLTIFHEKDLAFVTENEDGVVTVFCIGQKPTNDYEIQITKTEVIV